MHFYWKMSSSRHCANRIVHNILKIDQKSLSKLFMTSQQTFTCSKSTRETLVVLMSLFFTIADFKQENAYVDRFFWLWNYIHLHIFFQIIKRYCQVHSQATSMFEIISIGMFQKEAIYFGLCWFTIHDPTIHDPTMHDSYIDYVNMLTLYRYKSGYQGSKNMSMICKYLVS